MDEAITNKMEKHLFDYELDSINDKNILITGGTTGIGRATAVLLAAHGGNVMIFGRHEQELHDAIHDILETGGSVTGLTADVSNLEDIQRVFKQVDEQMGRLDILINNAALAYKSIMKGKYQDWQYIVDTNLMGYMAMAHEAIERMRARKEGHIVNIGSISAEERDANSSVYVATKSGIQGFSESLRKEVSKLGIKVSLIEPGLVGTDFQKETPEEQRKLEDELKMLKAEDIAASILYILTQPRRCDVTVLQIRPHIEEP